MIKLKQAELDQLLATLLCFFALAMVGCGGRGSGSQTPPPTPVNPALTGNWQFEVTSSGTPPFNAISGFVNQQDGSGPSYLTTASLQVQATGCFSLLKVLDLEGYTNYPLSQLSAFPFSSQVVSLGLSQQCTGVSLCGTYTVVGGCADGSTGTIIGTKYTTLDGTLQTASGVTPNLQMTISQSTQGTGQGGFQVSGKLSSTGNVCFTSATIDSTQSDLSGSSLHLVAATDATGFGPLFLDGTINPAATTLTVNNIRLTGSSCLDSVNGASLFLTP